MSGSPLKDRARRYAESVEIDPVALRPLGHGQDGCVWNSGLKTAVKVFERQRNYCQELECYQRLGAAGIEAIGGFSVPKLIGYSDELMVVEMELVTPPFILDFGKVYLDGRPEHTPEVWEEWSRERRKLFGEERWPTVLAILAALEKHGIYYQDPKPGNIMFPKEGG